MNDVGDVGYLIVEHSAGIGVGDHEGGGIFVNFRSQIIEIDASVGSRPDLGAFHAADSATSRVRTVGTVWCQHDLSFAPAVSMICVNHHESGHLAMGSGGRLKGDIG